MRAKVAVLLVLFISSSPAFPQVIGTQDTTWIGIGAGSLATVYGQKQLDQLNSMMEMEASRFEADVRAQSAEMNNLLNEAKTVEVGKPNAQSRSLYSGKFIEASEYEKFAGEAAQMKSNKYRLQTEGAKKILEALMQESALQSEKISLTLHRVHGSLNGSQIRMASPSVLQGSLEDVAKQLMDAVAAQSPTQTPGSIVAVELKYNTYDKPNPQAAAKLRSRAQDLEKTIEAKKQQVKPQVEAVEKKYSAAIKKMKLLRNGGIAAIPASIVFGFIRYSFAQSMITLANACVDAEQLNTLTATISVQSELDAEDVAYDLREICAQ